MLIKHNAFTMPDMSFSSLLAFELKRRLSLKMDSEGVKKCFKDLLECPTLNSVPIYQCLNGHVVCKDCHQNLETCPICRDGPISLRNLKLEEIVKRYIRYRLGAIGFPPFRHLTFWPETFRHRHFITRTFRHVHVLVL